jgi:type I site-specific restriction endonuclease
MRTGFGFADYLLYVDRKAAGAVEAKAQGTLSGVEAQSAKYAAGLPEGLPAHRQPLPFLFESNGAVTYFTNGLDPMPPNDEPASELLKRIAAERETRQEAAQGSTPPRRPRAARRRR